MPDQFVCARPRDSGDVEGDGRVFQYRIVTDREKVLEVSAVGRGPRIRLGPTLIARATCEFDERFPTVRIGVPGYVFGRQEFCLGDEPDLQSDRFRRHARLPSAFPHGTSARP